MIWKNNSESLKYEVVRNKSIWLNLEWNRGTEDYICNWVWVNWRSLKRVKVKDKKSINSFCEL